MRPTAHDPLRELTEAERAHLAVLLRATSERADVRQRVVALLAVAEGQSPRASRTKRPLAARATPRGIPSAGWSSGSTRGDWRP